MPYKTLAIKVLTATTPEWVQTSTTIDYNQPDLAHAKFDAENQARFFGGYASLWDRDRLLWTSKLIVKERSARVTNLRYSGQDADDQGNVAGYGFLNLIPVTYIYKKSERARSGWVLWSYVQIQIDADISIRRMYAQDVALRRAIETRDYWTANHPDAQIIAEVNLPTWSFRLNTAKNSTERWEYMNEAGDWISHTSGRSRDMLDQIIAGA